MTDGDGIQLSQQGRFCNHAPKIIIRMDSCHSLLGHHSFCEFHDSRGGGELGPGLWAPISGHCDPSLPVPVDRNVGADGICAVHARIGYRPYFGTMVDHPGCAVHPCPREMERCLYDEFSWSCQPGGNR